MTQDVVLTNPSVDQNMLRRIGKVAVVGRQQAPWVYEIVHSHSNKKTLTKSTFEEGIEQMYEEESFNIARSVDCFRKVLEEDPDDYVACMRFQRLQELASDTNLQWHYEDRHDFK